MSEHLSNYWLALTSLAESPLVQFFALVGVLVLVGTGLVKVAEWVADE